MFKSVIIEKTEKSAKVDSKLICYWDSSQFFLMSAYSMKIPQPKMNLFCLKFLSLLFHWATLLSRTIKNASLRLSFALGDDDHVSSNPTYIKCVFSRCCNNPQQTHTPLQFAKNQTRENYKTNLLLVLVFSWDLSTKTTFALSVLCEKVCDVFRAGSYERVQYIEYIGF